GGLRHVRAAPGPDHRGRPAARLRAVLLAGAEAPRPRARDGRRRRVPDPGRNHPVQPLGSERAGLNLGDPAGGRIPGSVLRHRRERRSQGTPPPAGGGRRAPRGTGGRRRTRARAGRGGPGGLRGVVGSLHRRRPAGRQPGTGRARRPSSPGRGTDSRRDTDRTGDPGVAGAGEGELVIGVLIGLAIVLALLILILPNSIRIVREYQRLVVFRLGRCIGTKGPGFVLLIPVVDRAVWVDLRELYLEIPHQTAITEDNAPISIDFIVFYKVMDAQQSVLAVGNFAGAAQNIAATTLRSVVGDMALDDCLAKREEMNEILRVKLDEVTERWGVKVTNVEIREIIPPPQVQEAMTRQMSAERTRRAVVTEAEGSKQAEITVAEGNKQAAILNAEGDRQAAILRAEGSALALTKISESAQAVDAKTMSLQYLDALKQIGASPSSKFVIPMELSSLLSGISGVAGRVFGDGGDGERAGPASSP